MIGHHVGVVREFEMTNSTNPVLLDDLAIQEFPHFRRRAEFAISPRMVWIFIAADTNLHKLFLSDWLSSAARPGSVDWTQLIASYSHEGPPSDSIALTT